MSYRVPLVKRRTRALRTHLLPAVSAGGLAFHLSRRYTGAQSRSLEGGQLSFDVRLMVGARVNVLMPWSREYLRDLLHDPDPIKAVFELDNISCSRPGRRETDPCFGLLPCQFAVHLFLNYQGDVGNGGHSQFFVNPVGAYANETLAALKELRFQNVHDILSRAVAVFPGSQVPKDWKERNDLVEGFSDDVFALWSQLDRELYSVDSACWPFLQQYLQDHESEILERDGS